MTDQDHPCQCRSILSETCAGSIAIVSKNNGLDIRDGGNDAPPEPEAIANAFLIAAAPDLFGALKSLVAAIHAGMAAEDGDDAAEDVAADNTFAALEMAEAALAKVDGERWAPT